MALPQTGSQRRDPRAPGLVNAESYTRRAHQRPERDDEKFLYRPLSSTSCVSTSIHSESRHRSSCFRPRRAGLFARPSANASGRLQPRGLGSLPSASTIYATPLSPTGSSAEPPPSRSPGGPVTQVSRSYWIDTAIFSRRPTRNPWLRSTPCSERHKRRGIPRQRSPHKRSPLRRTSEKVGTSRRSSGSRTRLIEKPLDRR